jgi:ATP-dependent DNA ligase
MLMRSPLARERKTCGLYHAVRPDTRQEASERVAVNSEIKHDGYRIIACKSGDRVRLWSRNGRDWAKEFLAVAEAVQALKADDIVLDGEAMAHCKDGLPDFHGLRSETAAREPACSRSREIAIADLE